ncbi:hypothetical protein [Streptomyces sp. NPDC007206]|uniref:hypothetical protein n=1 Tax=Streptomyces sp. NPDC007206 TaxID=3154317 RepID=UPI0033DEF315
MLVIVLAIVRKAQAPDLPQVLNGISNIILSLSALLPWSASRSGATSSTSTTTVSTPAQQQDVPSNAGAALSTQQAPHPPEGSS